MNRPATVKVLELSPDCLTAPTPLHVAHAGAVMLWPDDAAARHLAEKSKMIEWGRDLLREGQLAVPVEEFAYAAVDAPTPDEIVRAANAVMLDGFIAGSILWTAVATKGSQSIGLIIAEISKALGLKQRRSTGTINTHVWKRYRCVSHLWAAYVSNFKDRHDKTFPCRKEELGELLGTAEAFRELGERTKTRQSPNPVLRPGEAVRLPKGLEVPTVSLSFAAIGK